MPKTVSRTRAPRTGLTAKALQFLTLNHESKALAARAADVKADLMDYVEEHGDEDDKGHKVVGLPEPIEIGGKTYTSLKRERRVSQAFDEEVAEEILTRHGLYEEATYQITVIDQDKIYVLNQEERISDDELDSMFSRTESFAFKPITG